MNKKVPQMFRTYIWIIDTIMRHQPITLSSLNERWLRSPLCEDGTPFNRNTFRNYINGIEEMFGVEITCNTSASSISGRYSYSITNMDELRHNQLTRQLLSTMTVAGAVRDSQHLKGRILLENVPSGDNLLLTLTRAMEQDRVLEVQYQKFADAEPYTCQLEPYCLKLFRQRWYLLAHRTDRTYLAIYALDRMRSVEETDQTFQMPDDFDAEEHFRHMFGVFQPTEEQKPVRIVLRAYRGEWNYLKTLPLHHSQKTLSPLPLRGGELTSQRVQTLSPLPLKGGEPSYVDFQYFMSPTLDLRIELLSRGSSIEVLEPLSLRQQMQQDLSRTVDLYR